MRRVLDESLRLQPTVPAITGPPANTLLAGKYPMRKDDWSVVMVAALHRDPRWGPDPDEFDPDRFRPEQGQGPARSASTNRSAPAKDHASGGNSRCTRPC